MEYGALLIPVLGAIILRIWWNYHIVWWEYVLTIVLSIIIGGLTIAGVGVHKEYCPEYWGSFVSRVEYYERWNEYIHQTCTSTCCCDEKGNNCQTTTYDCSYVSNHPPKWVMHTTIGETLRITKEVYQKLVNQFGNTGFTDMHRSYHTIDGDMYYSTWKGDSSSAEPATTLHHYRNKIKSSNLTIFNYTVISPNTAKELGLYQYPIVDLYEQNTLLTKDSSFQKEGKSLSWWNAQLGPLKQARLYVLLFDESEKHLAPLQESYWVGSNMNEFVVCLGLDKNKQVKWSHSFSWNYGEKMKPLLRSFVETTDSVSVQMVIDYLGPLTKAEFKRRDFSEFDYLTIELSTYDIIIVYIITILVTIGMMALVVNNSHIQMRSSW